MSEPTPEECPGWNKGSPQVEIDEYRDYDKAAGALKEAGISAPETLGGKMAALLFDRFQNL